MSTARRVYGRQSVVGRILEKHSPAPCCDENPNCTDSFCVECLDDYPCAIVNEIWETMK